MLRTGDTVRFGRYQQDIRQKEEEIAWRVLDIQGSHALLLSDEALAVMPYHKQNDDCVWADSTLRRWLNRTFLRSAFTKEEQAAVLLTKVDNGPDQGYPEWAGVSGGKDTEDYLFLLSYREAFSLYFETDEARRCGPTQVARAEMENSEPAGACVWWLRSPGKEPGRAACVWTSGARRYLSFNAADVCVRPALWVDMTLWPFEPENR